jgi:hypothetical protein
MESPKAIHGYKWVLCSDELLAALGDSWSPPVQLRLTRIEGDTLEFEARHANVESFLRSKNAEET